MNKATARGRTSPPEFVEALAKGLAVLRCFDAANPEMTLSEIARRVSLSPATARRSLITLMALGYVGQAAKRFHLKPAVMSLGSAFYFAARIDELLLPELRRIVETFGEAASVATLDGQDVVYVAQYSTQRALRAAAVVGARYPAYATSLGRVLLAGLSDAELDGYFEAARPAALTAKTVTAKSELRRLVQKARESGYATEVDQLDYGVTALAAPVRGADGATIAAVNSSGYSGMVDADRMVVERLPALRIAAARIAEAAARYPALASMLGAGEARAGRPSR